MHREEINSLEQERDPEGESPYRRRTKAVGVRRGRLPRRLGRVLKWLLRATLVAAPVAYGGYEFASYALRSPRFTISSPENVVVYGNRYVSRADVLDALGVPTRGPGRRGVNILRMSLEGERRQIESLPWVESATLARSFPDHLRVWIVERAPIAFVNVGGRVKLIDGAGVVLDKPEGASFVFPVLSGLEAAANSADRASRLALYQRFMQDVADDAYASGWLVSEVGLSDPDDVEAVLVEGLQTIQVHFGHEDFKGRLENFLTLLPEVRKTHAIIDSVDLRYRGQIVVNPVRQARGNGH